MTSALGGRGLLAMFSGMCGAVTATHYGTPLNCQYDNIVLVAECPSTDFYRIRPPSMHYEQRSQA